MSTVSPTSTPEVSIPISAAPTGPSESTVDHKAVERARREIQALVQELAQLARSQVEPGEFYEAMLSRIVTALAAEGGAVWTIADEGRLELAYQINLRQAGLVDGPQRQTQHAALLQSVLESGQDTMVQPQAGTGTDQGPSNPSDHLLILGVVRNDEGPRGVVEIFQRAKTQPSTQRGYLVFVKQMCQLAGDYLKGQRLQHYTDKESLWEQLESFTQSVHQGLDLRRTTYTIANEGRRLIGCDRVSVAIRRGGKFRVEAISGQESFDRRSNVVTRLGRLATAVSATGETMWYTSDTSQLAPQVEKALESYLDLAHSKMIAVLPLARPTKEDATQGPPEVVAALIVEQIEDSQPQQGLIKRVDVVAEHSATALSNAMEHQSLFLLPVWKTLGKLRPIVAVRALPKTLAVLLGIVAVIAALAIVPADFELEAKGTLQPTERRDVFAGIDGVVIEVEGQHGKTVEQGAVLAQLRNTDLEVQITDLVGRREATTKQMHSLERAMLGETRLAIDEQNRISGQLLQLRKTYESLGRQLDLYRQKQQQLQVTSPIAGQIVTWQVRQQLMRRPVRQGQVLMSIADPTGPWELELHMPEDRMGHIAEAAKASDKPLEVTYILATDPGTSHVGQVTEMHAAAQLRGDEGNTVLLRVAVDKSQLKDLRPGSSVSAKVDCGNRSIGYVWLHDLITFVQSRILFRL